MTVTVFSFLTRALGFVFKVYVSRKLGAEAVGLYQISMSVLLLFLSVCSGGVPSILSRSTAELMATGGDRRADSMLTTAVLWCGGSALAVIGITFAASGLLSKLFADERCVRLLLIMLPALFTTSVYSCVRSYFWGRKQYSSFSLAELLEEGFRLVFVFVLASGVVASVSGATSIAVAVVVGDLVSLFVLLGMFFKRGGRFSKPQGFKELAKKSAPLTATRIAGSVVGSLTALIIPLRLIASGMTAAEATATFGRMTGMVLPLIMAPTMLTGALAVVLIPEIAAANIAKKTDLVEKRTKLSVLFVTAMSLFFTAVLFALGEELVEFLFKDDIAGKTVKYAALLVLPINVNQISNTILNSLGGEKKLFAHYVAGALLLVVSLVVLTPYMGIYSMLAGTGLCFCTTSLLNLLAVKKKLRTKIIDYRRTLLCLFVCAVSAAVGWFLQNMLQNVFGNFYICLLVGVVVTVLYAAGVFGLGVLSTDWIIVWRQRAFKSAAFRARRCTKERDCRGRAEKRRKPCGEFRAVRTKRARMREPT